MKNLISLTAVFFAFLVSTVSAQRVQLDISSGFNTDNWTGYREFQELITVGGTDLQDAQGASPLIGQGRQALDRFNFGLIGAIDSPTAEAHGLGSNDGGSTWYGYALSTSWWRNNTAPAGSPAGWVTDAAATPLDGVLTGGDGREYHIASHAGNATLPGDWLQATDVSFTGSGASVTTPMAMKLNAMTIYSPHSIGGGQITSVTANLSAAQQGQYSDINFVFAGWDAAGGARNAQIVAVYSDASEDILYTFADGAAVGPIHEDGTGTFDPGEFNVVDTYSFGYNVASGSTGSVTAKNGSLYEFATPFVLDSAKTLVGIRLEDSNPTLNSSERGLSIYGVTGTVIPEPSTVLLLGLSMGILFFKWRRHR